HGRSPGDRCRQAGASRDRGRLPHSVGECARGRRALRGRRDDVPHEGSGARRDRRRDHACGGRSRMNLTADNTAIVLDSTADFPDAQQHHANWRVVPLYVNFGTESYKDGVDLTAREFYERLRTSTELPTTSQPTPGDFLAVYEELASTYERILSVHLASNLSGTFQSANTAAEQLGGDRVRTIDSESASVATSLLGLAIQRRLERGT